MNAEKPVFKMPDIFIDARGDWHADGVKMVHKKILRLFRDSLESDDAGGYRIRIENEVCPVRVEDAPFVVCRVVADAAGGLCAALNDGRVEPFRPETLSRRGDTALYCLVRGGVRARIGLSAYPDIISMIDQDAATGEYVFRVADGEFLIRKEGV